MPSLDTTIMAADGKMMMPETIMKALGLAEPAEISVRLEGDKIVMSVLRTFDRESAWREIFKRFDEKGIKMSEDEVVAEIHEYRKERRRQQA